jgi:hypothetical protein
MPHRPRFATGWTGSRTESIGARIAATAERTVVTEGKMSGTGAKIFATRASTVVSEIGWKTFETCVKTGSIDARIGEIDAADEPRRSRRRAKVTKSS